MYVIALLHMVEKCVSWEEKINEPARRPLCASILASFVQQKGVYALSLRNKSVSCLLHVLFAGYSSDPAWFSEPNMHALIWRPAYG